MNITVYLGAAFGNDPCLQSEAEKLGAYIGQAGHTLVYGGSQNGLMGVLAKSAKNNGARVIGVEPQFFIDMGFDYDAITQLIVTETMQERKKIMLEMGDVYIAFPGGTGTLEEITEIMSMVCLGHLTAPCIVYNLNGYYDSLKDLLANMVRMGLAYEDKIKRICFAENLEDIKKILE